jgi:hypothetical protein
MYLFWGDDIKNKQKSYEEFINSLPAQAGATNGAEIFSISRNDFDKVQIESLYSGAGLFSSKYRVVFKNILDTAETRDFILEKLDLMEQSQNDFIFLEGKLNKATLDAFKKAGQKRLEIKSFELPKEKKEKFNNFLLANAFGAKDKLNLWIYFRQAMDKGVGMEELIGVLFWKIKDMILKKDFRKFSEMELKNSASRISYLLPQARKIGIDPEIAFEQFLLEAF